MNKAKVIIKEEMWSKTWIENKQYEIGNNIKRNEKAYILDMFPYPSGAGLHTGHIEGYTGTDILARYMRMKGKKVLHPIGWDAFGLPAENYAIKNGIPPAKSTHDNIDNFRRQIRSAGLSYDWSREVDTSDSNYYKWTQWIFTVLFKRGLAYKKSAQANWCPSCETVLANEQVIDGKCERCGTAVQQKEVEQWFFRITQYADRMIDGLKNIDWPNSTKTMQENWIGRKEGAKVKFKVTAADKYLEAFTTRIDTICGVTFVVAAPEVAIKILDIIPADKKAAVEAYVTSALNKTQLERKRVEGEKNGINTGLFVTNPINGEQIPVWVADYVMMDVGTGVVMGVPAHDERDFVFAKKYQLPIRQVIEPLYQTYEADKPYEGEGKLVNSGEFDGMEWKEAQQAIIKKLETKKLGEFARHYHMRDWLVSRQRYWGAPIPMIYCELCAAKGLGEVDAQPGWYPVPDDKLPVLLPTDVDFNPKGYSPLMTSKTFQAGVKCPRCGSTKARREVDTMDTFVDSSWYFLRFCDPHNQEKAWSTEALAAWMPVDVYVGGAEHTVLHLMYSRFLYMVFWDLGLVPKEYGDEPFVKLRHPGMILGEDSRKMSKRWGNVINPDDIVGKYGADTMRMYEMFMGPFDAMKPWSQASVEGIYRFVQRVERLFETTMSETNKQQGDASDDVEAERLTHWLIKRVTENIEQMDFNLAIAGMMEFYNKVSNKPERISNKEWKKIWNIWLRVMAPLAPFMAEELWQRTNGRSSNNFASGKQMAREDSVHFQAWPSYDENQLTTEKLTVVVQVNGKVREKLDLPTNAAKDEGEVIRQALAKEKIKAIIGGREYKAIFVPGKIVNFVI